MTVNSFNDPLVVSRLFISSHDERRHVPTTDPAQYGTNRDSGRRDSFFAVPGPSVSGQTSNKEMKDEYQNQ